MNYIYYLIAAFVFAVVVHLIADKKARDVHSVADVLMRYFVFMFFGISALIAATAHIFAADKIAITRRQLVNNYSTSARTEL